MTAVGYMVLLLVLLVVLVRETGKLIKDRSRSRMVDSRFVSESFGTASLTDPMANSDNVIGSLLDSRGKVATRSALIVTALLGTAVAECLRLSGLLNEGWRWWHSVLLSTGVCSIGAMVIVIIVAWWNHSRFIGRLIAYGALSALLLLCAMLGTLLQ